MDKLCGGGEKISSGQLKFATPCGQSSKLSEELVNDVPNQGHGVEDNNNQRNIESDKNIGILTLSPIGFNLGLDCDNRGIESNEEEILEIVNVDGHDSGNANVHDEGGHSNRKRGFQRVGEWGLDHEDFLQGDDLVLLNDAAPFQHNVRHLSSDIANMNLKKGGDAIYVGKMFKDKKEMHNYLSVYSIKRLFNFKIQESDKTRVIAVCQDPNCSWRVYATNHKNSNPLEIRRATINHTCDVAARSEYGKKATTTILGELMKGKYAHGKKGPRACDLPDILLT